MVPAIGEWYVHNGDSALVRDRDNIAMTAQVGVPDSDGLMPPWECKWVPWSELLHIDSPAPG